jgi:hypothetical protein
MHFRHIGNTTIVYSVLVHRDIEVRIGLTPRQARQRGLADEDIGHTLEARADVAVTRVVRDPNELRTAIEHAENVVGRSAADRLSSIEEIADYLWGGA